uniref:Uncharacterized protein n=1 Tax=Oryza sativa subsp. japonica TaxID=39947 RepID=Q5Z5P7_ORYSJ|nr:hypothetical protein [Oryza sativa Japonica Group]
MHASPSGRFCCRCFPEMKRRRPPTSYYACCCWIGISGMGVNDECPASTTVVASQRCLAAAASNRSCRRCQKKARAKEAV